jgi:hypothetical protein
MPGFTPGVISVQVLSGQTVSSAFCLPRGDSPIVIVGSNGTAASLSVQFSTTSGGPAWYTLTKLVGDGAAHSCYSGTGAAVAIVPHPATPYGRLSLSAAPSDVVSYLVLERRAPS